MKEVSVEYLNFTGRGKNRTEAKADATRQAQAFIRDAVFGPTVLPLGTLVAVIARVWDGWQYQLWPNGGRTSGHCSKTEAERAARKHAAQQLSEIPGDPRRDLILNEEDLRDHMRWFAWQCKYKVLRDKGHSDADARRMADDSCFAAIASEQAGS